MQNSFDDQVNRIVRFSITAFLWAWIWWLPRILATFDVIQLSPLWDAILGVVGSLGPGLSALYQTYRSDGKNSISSFLKRGWNFSINWVFLLPAAGIMPLIGGITTGILALTGMENPWEYSLLSYTGLPAALVIILLLVSAVGEEYGWRGFVQEKMQTVWNPFKTSLLLGVIWGAWQLPLHFISGTLQSALPVMQIILQTTALSVLFTWLYNRSGRSLLIATFFHFSISLSSLVFPIWAGIIAQWATLLLIVASILAMGLLVGMRKQNKI